MKKIIAALSLLILLKTVPNTTTATPLLFSNYADTTQKPKPAVQVQDSTDVQDSTAAYDTAYNPKTVRVKGYYRKDGKYVAPYTRSAPRKKH